MDPNKAETRPAQEGRMEVALRAKSKLESFSREGRIERDVNWFESPDGPLRLAEQIANLGPDLGTVMSQIDIELVDGVSIRARRGLFPPEGEESATTFDANRRVIAATFKGEKPKGREPIPDHVMFADNVTYWFDHGATDRRLASLSRMTKAEVVKKIREGLDKWVPFSEKVKGPVGKVVRAGAVAAVATSVGLISDQIRPPQSTVEDGAAATQVIQEGMEQRYAEAGLGTPGGTYDEQYVRRGGSGSGGKGTGGEVFGGSTAGATPTPETKIASTTDSFGQTRESIRNGTEAVFDQLMDGIEAGVDKEHRYSLQIGEKGVYQGRIVIFPEPVIDQNGKEVLIAITRDGAKSISTTTTASDPEHPINIPKDVFRNFIKGKMNELKQNGKDFIPYGQASLGEDQFGRITTFQFEDPTDPEHRTYHYNLNPNPPTEMIEEAMKKSQEAAGLRKGEPPKNLYDALKPLLNP